MCKSNLTAFKLQPVNVNNVISFGVYFLGGLVESKKFVRRFVISVLTTSIVMGSQCFVDLFGLI